MGNCATFENPITQKTLKKNEYLRLSDDYQYNRIIINRSRIIHELNMLFKYNFVIQQGQIYFWIKKKRRSIVYDRFIKDWNNGRKTTNETLNCAYNVCSHEHFNYQL